MRQLPSIPAGIALRRLDTALRVKDTATIPGELIDRCLCPAVSCITGIEPLRIRVLIAPITQVVFPVPAAPISTQDWREVEREINACCSKL